MLKFSKICDQYESPNVQLIKMVLVGVAWTVLLLDIRCGINLQSRFTGF